MIETHLAFTDDQFTRCNINLNHRLRGFLLAFTEHYYSLLFFFVINGMVNVVVKEAADVNIGRL